MLSSYVIFIGDAALPEKRLNEIPQELRGEGDSHVLLFFGVSPIVRLTILVTEGYLLYDLTLLLWYWKLVGGATKDYLFVIHHVLGVVGLGYICVRGTIHHADTINIAPSSQHTHTHQPNQKFKHTIRM